MKTKTVVGGLIVVCVIAYFGTLPLRAHLWKVEAEKFSLASIATFSDPWNADRLIENLSEDALRRASIGTYRTFTEEMSNTFGNLKQARSPVCKVTPEKINGGRDKIIAFYGFSANFERRSGDVAYKLSMNDGGAWKIEQFIVNQ